MSMNAADPVSNTQSPHLSYQLPRFCMRRVTAAFPQKQAKHRFYAAETRGKCTCLEEDNEQPNQRFDLPLWRQGFFHPSRTDSEDACRCGYGLQFPSWRFSSSVENPIVSTSTCTVENKPDFRSRYSSGVDSMYAIVKYPRCSAFPSRRVDMESPPESTTARSSSKTRRLNACRRCKPDDNLSD